MSAQYICVLFPYTSFKNEDNFWVIYVFFFLLIPTKKTQWIGLQAWNKKPSDHVAYFFKQME